MSLAENKSESDDRSTVLQYVPHISIAAAILASVFNVGYFVPIGIHFLGIMDFSNFVYSLAIAFALILVILGVAPLLAGLNVTAITAAQRLFSKAIWFLPLIITILAILAVLVHEKAIPRSLVLGFSSLDIMLFTVCIFFVRSVTAALATFHAGRVDESWATMSVCSAIAIALLVGASISEDIILSAKGTRYRFELKNSYEEISAKVLRSSSAGFLISKDGDVIFLPKEEIKRVSVTPRT